MAWPLSQRSACVPSLLEYVKQPNEWWWDNTIRRWGGVERSELGVGDGGCGSSFKRRKQAQRCEELWPSSTQLTWEELGLEP